MKITATCYFSLVKIPYLLTYDTITFTRGVEIAKIYTCPVFSTSASSRRFYLLLKAEEPATLVQNAAISLIFVNENLSKRLNSLETSAFEELGSEFINFASNCVINTLRLIVYLTELSI